MTHPRLLRAAFLLYRALFFYVLAVAALRVGGFEWPACLAALPLLWTCAGYARDGSLAGVALGAVMVPAWWSSAAMSIGPAQRRVFLVESLAWVPLVAMALGVVALGIWLWARLPARRTAALAR